MTKSNFPTTPAIRYLNDKNIKYQQHIYEYEEKGGTKQTAEVLNVDEHFVIKTLIFNADSEEIIVLMHGDCEVSTKELARLLNVKKVEPTTAEKANKATGYLFGGTSPFGTRKSLPIYIEESILSLQAIYINGGKRGFILEMPIEELQKALTYTTIQVAIPH